MLKWLTRRIWPATKATWKQWNEDDGFLLSAAMAYYAAFSLFPLLLVLIAGVGLLTRFPSLHLLTRPAPQNIRSCYLMAWVTPTVECSASDTGTTYHQR